MQHGKLCLATGDSADVTSTNEDCLFLDVFAPTNATATSKLPVFLFIQGGGFNSNSNPNLNGSSLILASNLSMVLVTFNYRVGPYGFLPVAGAANNGLRDQRKAMEWVGRHIAGFGGDPNHVVLGGASAGAGSIALHLTAEGGKDTGLFHGAAAESVSFATVLTIDQSRYQYETFALRVGCLGGQYAPYGRRGHQAVLSVDTMACLRSRSVAQLQRANHNMPYPGADKPPLYMWNPVVDGDFLRDFPYNAFAQGKFVKVPLIMGDDTNGGSVFTPRSTSTVEDSDSFLHNQFPYLTADMLAQINTLFPNQNTSCPARGCFWKQVSDAYGQLRYRCPGLYISAAATRAGMSRSFAYRYNVEDPDQLAQGIGVPHTTDTSAVFGPAVGGGGPRSYYPTGKNALSVKVTQGYWMSFIRTLNPNTYRYNGSAVWDPWTDEKRNRLVFDSGGNTAMEQIDDVLKKRCDYFASIGAKIQQ